MHLYIDLRINFEPSQFMSHLMVQGFSWCLCHRCVIRFRWRPWHPASESNGGRRQAGEDMCNLLWNLWHMIKKNRSIFSDVYLVHLMHPAHFQASPLPGHHWSPAVNFFRPTGHFGLGWRAWFCCQHGQVAVHHRSPSAQTPGEGWMATPHALVWKSWFIMGDPYIPLVCICKLSTGKQILVNDKIQKRFIL
jgi:hypothetical protein